MCGIAGLVTKDGSAPPLGVLDAMAGALGHRGPDGRGNYVQGGTGMVHRRLAIIDLETGDQPLRDAGGAALVANAEIYNYVELREELGETAFTTKSDCEPILALYRRHGREFAARLRGMYALALHDPDAGDLILARDPFGIKPLYYAETETAFLFASEPCAILASGLIAAATNLRARNELLQLQFTTGQETIFEGVRRVLPGEMLIVSQGRVVARSRQAALPSGAPTLHDEKNAIAALDAALKDSVQVHQRSDVPYGMFLSGGIDSAALLSLMAELNSEPVIAYTMGFGPEGRDETELARTLAGKLGARHVTIEISAKDLLTRLPEVVAALDDPVADYAALPVFLLAEAAARDVKVVLTGEGGDELFAGYGRYRSALRPLWLGGRAMRARGLLSGLGVLRDEQPGWRDGIVAAESIAGLGGRTRLQTAQAIDCADWLPHDLLTKIDRCLMAHGVEGRTPFLDPAVAQVAFRLGDRLKIRNGFGKYLLRRWLSRRLPEAKAFARKRGFTVPVGPWIQQYRKGLAPLVARQSGIREACDAERVAELFQRDDKHAGLACWVLLFYALWHQIHFAGVSPHGDILDVLDVRT